MQLWEGNSKGKIIFKGKAIFARRKGNFQDGACIILLIREPIMDFSISEI